MHNKVPRALLNIIHKRLGSYPAVALLGARQVGKTTLARQIVEQVPGALYLDLQKASDRAKIENDPELFLQLNKDHLVCLDEIQLLPEIFSSMRSSIDDTRRP